MYPHSQIERNLLLLMVHVRGSGVEWTYATMTKKVASKLWAKYTRPLYNFILLSHLLVDFFPHLL